MPGPHPLYRGLIRLYPSAFRHEYGEDLLAHYADLVAERGARAARARTALDLAITIPRYPLERVMTEQHSAIVLSLVIGLFTVGGLASLMTGQGPGVLLFVVAIVLAVAKGSTLSRALSVPNSKLRRRRLQTAAVLASVFVVLWFTWDLWVDDAWSIRETLVTTVGVLAIFAAIVFLIAGLLTPRSPEHHIARTAG